MISGMWRAAFFTPNFKKMTRRINRGNKEPLGKIGCSTAEKLKEEKIKREQRRLQVKIDRDGR
jgi:hypothetical protein